MGERPTYGPAAKLHLRPCTVRQAKAFNFETHRRLPKVQGAMWCARVEDEVGTVGVALVGAAARVWNGRVLAVLRCAVMPGYFNACSMLYGACSRAARALGAEDLVTYTHGDEHGASLRASGFVYAGVTDGGEWGRDGRPRQLAIDPQKKNRWFAAWGKRAKEILAANPPERAEGMKGGV